MLNKISERYFAILRDYFGGLLDWSSKKGRPKSQLGMSIAELYNPSLMKTTMETLTQELMSLNWANQSSAIERIGGLRTAYLGHGYIWQSRPEKTFDFLKKTSLYTDTVIVNDPILTELLAWQERGTGEIVSFTLVAADALSLLPLEDLFNSDVGPPVCCLAPCQVISFKNMGIDKIIDEFLDEHVVSLYASELLGRELKSKKELMEYLSTFRDFEDFISNVQKSDLKLADVYGRPVEENDYLTVKQYYEDRYNMPFSLPDSLFLFIRGRFLAAAVDLILNGKIASNFATEFKGVWNNFSWLLKNDNALVNGYLRKKPISKDGLIITALQQEEFKWIGNVPLAKIRELRERGELQEIRALLGQNVNALENASDEEFAEVGRQVRYNLDEAFKKHNLEVKELDAEFKAKYKIDVASIVVSGSLGLVSALFPPLVLATGIASGIVGGGSIIKTAEDYINKRSQLQALRKKPIAMLFDASIQSKQ